MAKAKYDLKIKAIALRKNGLSYRDILKKLSVAKSSLSYWLRDIVLTKDQKDEFKKRQSESAKKMNKPTKDRKIWSSKGGKSVQKLYGKRLAKNLVKGRAIANLAYRKDELPIKAQLELITNQSFNKEKIDGFFVDFSNDKYLIEYTADNTHGLHDAINRLNSISDPRIKIIITHINRIGNVRLNRCKKIILLDIKDFNMNKWIEP